MAGVAARFIDALDLVRANRSLVVLSRPMSGCTLQHALRSHLPLIIKTTHISDMLMCVQSCSLVNPMVSLILLIRNLSPICVIRLFT